MKETYFIRFDLWFGFYLPRGNIRQIPVSFRAFLCHSPYYYVLNTYVVRMAEWSKAPDSSSGPQLRAWVQIPLLTFLLVHISFNRQIPLEPDE